MAYIQLILHVSLHIIFINSKFLLYQSGSVLSPVSKSVNEGILAKLTGLLSTYLLIVTVYIHKVKGKC